MTGKELNDIYNTSGLTGKGFAEKLGISRATLYQLFKHPKVSSEIEETVIMSGLKKDLSLQREHVSVLTEINVPTAIKNVPKASTKLHEGKALQFYLKLEHGGIARFAKAMGFSGNSYAYMYELFNNEVISDVNWGKFRDKVGITKSMVMEKYILLHSSDAPVGKGVPVYNVDFTAGDVTQFADFQEKVIGHIDLTGFRKCIAFVKVKGNSMFPTFTAGDLVGLEPQEDFKIIDYGLPFAIVTKSGQSLIKIIRRGKDNDNLILRSNNKDYDDIDIHKDDILKLYKAHGPVRDSHY